MQYLHLGKEAREALDEPALRLLEKYDAEIIEAMPPGFDNTELQEYSDKYTAELRQKASYYLGRYFQAKGGEAALSELAHNLQPIIATIKSLFSQFTETKRLETEAKRLEEELSKPLGILKLDSTVTAVLYPHAQKRFNDWKEELNKEVPELGELTIEEITADVNDHLDDNEKTWATKYEEIMVEWLSKCTDRGGEELNSAAYAGWVISSMSSLKGLLKKVYEQKKVKAEEERQRQEDEAKLAEWKKQWGSAWDELYPARLKKKVYQYLNKEELPKWHESLGAAAAAYVDGDTNLASKEASEYQRWRGEIAKREEEENKRLRAHVLATV